MSYVCTYIKFINIYTFNNCAVIASLDHLASTEGVPTTKTRVIKPPKPLDDKERRRLLIKKVKKKADSTHRASQRRQSQQARRQREKAMIKQAKEHLDKVNKQKEAEVNK